MRRRDFILAPAVCALTSCTPALLRPRESTAQLAPFALTPIDGPFTMTAKLLDPVCGTVGYACPSGINPTLVFERGQLLSAAVKNALPQPTTLHWHGLHVPALMDGDGRSVFATKQSQSAQFVVSNRSGLYWYHAHPHGYSAEQIQQGLAGMVIVRDAEDRAVEASLATTPGETDLALMLKDTLWINNQRVPYRPDADTASGLLGNVVTVNDLAAPRFDVSRGWVRLRLLNASNTRALLIEANHESKPMSMQLLGTDGGLLGTPVLVERIFMHPGERIDFAFDCSKLRPGEMVAITSAEFDPRNQLDPKSVASRARHPSVNHLPPLAANSLCAGNSESATRDGALMPLFSMRISDEPLRSGSLPSRLSAIEAAQDDGSTQRKIALAFDPDKGWTINNQRWGDDALTQHVTRGSTEIWELHNSPLSVPHPMHLHGFSFRVLSRRGLFGPARALATHSNNRVATDLGLKDTVTVWPNERVRILIDFSHIFVGEQRYLFHCHNLQHEDQMMMLPVLVTQSTGGVCDCAIAKKVPLNTPPSPTALAPQPRPSMLYAPPYRSRSHYAIAH